MREKIIEILRKHTVETKIIGEMFRTTAPEKVLWEGAFKKVADEILKLKIECPDEWEIDEQANQYSTVDYWEQEGFKAGANYVKNEIAKRNQ